MKNTCCINTDDNSKRLKGPAVATQDMKLNVLAGLNTRQIASEQNISHGIVMRIKKKNKYKSYKYQKYQEIKITDMEWRN